MSGVPYKAAGPGGAAFHGIGPNGRSGHTMVLLAGDTCMVEFDTLNNQVDIQTQHDIVRAPLASFHEALEQGEIVPVPADTLLLKPKKKVPNAADVAGMLRARPGLLFNVLQELRGLKLAGPWIRSDWGSGVTEESRWERQEAFTLNLLVRITQRSNASERGEAWHITFPGVRDLGVRTDLVGFDVCQIYADVELHKSGYILCDPAVSQG